MRRSVNGIRKNDKGAVAPTVALSLFALIAAGSVAFDYARLATLDTELQNAADQAALAAASQLDGEANACSRAAAAAANLINNRTLMANDSSASTAPAIIIANESTCDATGTIRFWQNKTKTTAATNDANAKFVEVQTASRTAKYTLTPVVSAFTGQTIYAQAFAGLGNAICKVPPLMMCNPNETADPNDEDFLVSNFVGRGIRLVANDGGGGYGPGNFGFLDTGYDGGANGLRQVLGMTAPPGDCVAESGVTTQPGAMVSVLDALNTRFDIYHGDTTGVCGADGSNCQPSTNTRKDVLKAGGGGPGSCAFQPGNGNAGWKIPDFPYVPTSATTPLTQAEANALSPMGYPRDMCHAISQTGSCTFGTQTPSRIGDRNWDRRAYFRSNRGVNYPEIAAMTDAQIDTWMASPLRFGTSTPTRYQVYAWEMANAATRLQSYQDPLSGNGANSRTSYGRPLCTTPGVGPSSTTIDRRVLSAAVVNCTEEGIAGRTTGVEVKHWIDIFLVEPSLPRANTEQSDVYIEVIRATLNASGNAVQTVKKSVPYLIE